MADKVLSFSHWESQTQADFQEGSCVFIPFVTNGSLSNLDDSRPIWDNYCDTFFCQYQECPDWSSFFFPLRCSAVLSY